MSTVVQPYQSVIFWLAIIGTSLFLLGAALGAGALSADSDRAIIARVAWGAAACCFTSLITIIVIV